MRRNWCIGIALLAVTMMIQSAFANMLVDPGFEETTAKWVTQNSVNANDWAARLGTNGLVFPGWSPGTGTIQQDVPATTLGEYIFSVYVQAEPGFNPSDVSISLEWKDADSNDCQSASVVSYSTLPGDQYWHHLRVSGVATAAAMQYVRVVIDGTWGSPNPGNSAFFIDDADLYEGAFVPVSLTCNNSFESSIVGSWQGSAWAADAQKDNGAVQNWVRRTGERAVSLYGWNDGSQGLFTSQPLSPMTGTYTFAFWTRRESTNFWWTNIQARIEWYDSTFTNKIMADSVTNIPAPADADWHQYYITATCTNEDLFEARPMAGVQWLRNTNDVIQKTAAIDDARWLSGGYVDNPVLTDWHYFCGLGEEPQAEQVPGTNVGTFIQINFAATTTTFFVLVDPDAKVYEQESLRAGLRTSYKRDDSGYQDDWRDMSYVGDIELDSGTPFHGLPAVGTKTLELWSYSLTQPTNMATDDGYRVYYAPYVRSLYGTVETGIRYLLRQNGDATNQYPINPQVFGPNPVGNDYNYVQIKPVPVAFTNGGFEYQHTAFSNNFNYTGWSMEGSYLRENWAANAGVWGASMPGWQTEGTTEGWLYQDIPADSRTNTLTAWFRIEQGYNATNTELRLDWYDSSYQVIQRDARNVMYLPNNGSWHPAYITSVCNSSDVLFVRASLYAKAFPKVGDPAAMFIDDVDVYAGEYRPVEKLYNGSLENSVDTAGGWRGTQWATIPEKSDFNAGAKRDTWAARSGNYGFAIISDDGAGAAHGPYETLLTQSMTPGTGTYTFSIWLNSESNSLMTNIVLSISSYDSGHVALQSTNYSVPLPLPGWRTWYRYDVTGVMDDPDTFEVTASVLFNWSITNQLNEQAFRVDDAQFLRGDSYPTNLIILDWSYYNAGSDPTNETIPSSAVGAFLQVNYATTTTTFYVLSETNAAVRSDETSAVGIHLWEPYGGDQWYYMSQVGSVVISNTAPFHGLPSSGEKTLALWKYDWTQPLDGGVPRTNAFTVYYAPYVDSLYDGVLITDRRYYNRQNSGSAFTNNYTINPQAFDVDWYDSDYSYLNQYTVDESTDGIPNAWWDRYGITGGDRVATNDPDTDTYNNFEEWVSDSDPTDTTSYYPNYVTNMSGRLEMYLRVGPPTTNSRRYRIYFMTNLMNQADGWTPCSADVPGDDDGAAVDIPVTNDAAGRFYRTGVALP